MTKIIDDHIKYGGKGQSWAPEFVKYMMEIVTHPSYKNMPDAVKFDGKIQWEAPSNRSGGTYQHTHEKRRNWWREKALSLSIDVTKDQWISRTAKLIHPTGQKPCKKCGRVMRISYVYPKAGLIARFKIMFGAGFEVSMLEPIADVVQRAYDRFGVQSLTQISKILTTNDIVAPDFNGDINAALMWLEEEYIPKEPSLLSPGAMSNAPDRFDGFHSFNRCCRGQADTGRHTINLLSYTTDRRVFEYWSDGDWIAADRLMGLVKTRFNDEACADGGSGAPSSDHIGPLSLGFCHRPEFRLLSKAANSAKNNRMTYWDVQHLRNCEVAGIQVASWYAKPLWDLRKNDVDSEEKALRLSKLLRDNQRNAMKILCRIYDEKRFAFLVYLLQLGFADREIEFENLRVEDFITRFDLIKIEERKTKYSIEQKARRLRIGFEALRIYMQKENRHTFAVEVEAVEACLREAITYLSNLNANFLELDTSIEKVMFLQTGVVSAESIRNLVATYPTQVIQEYENAKAILTKGMIAVGKHLSNLWESNRYGRG